MLIFSWVYELTPEGLKKQHEVDLNQSITHETGRKINYLIGALAVLAIVVVAAERFIPRTAPIPAATGKDSARSAPPPWRHRSRRPRPNPSRCCRSRT